jgi:hypothetical protein
MSPLKSGKSTSQDDHATERQLINHEKPDDSFSHKYEQSLSVSATYKTLPRMLIVNVNNTSDKAVSINRPVLCSAGNLYIRHNETIPYPPLGSCAFTKSKIVIPKGRSISFEYILPNDSIITLSKDKYYIDAYLDDVNDEDRRTQFSGPITVISE